MRQPRNKKELHTQNALDRIKKNFLKCMVEDVILILVCTECILHFKAIVHGLCV